MHWLDDCTLVMSLAILVMQLGVSKQCNIKAIKADCSTRIEGVLVCLRTNIKSSLYVKVVEEPDCILRSILQFMHTSIGSSSTLCHHTRQYRYNFFQNWWQHLTFSLCAEYSHHPSPFSTQQDKLWYIKALPSPTYCLVVSYINLISSLTGTTYETFNSQWNFLFAELLFIFKIRRFL